MLPTHIRRLARRLAPALLAAGAVLALSGCYYYPYGGYYGYGYGYGYRPYSSGYGYSYPYAPY
ncbi:MAG: hypothetical protein JOY70_06605 [Acidisphaera sp.]|nr:hypothetical protein [Acidisphaera sp.]MBV9813617.1 hypothetical protein [Acetobacteraceae bacterium]